MSKSHPSLVAMVALTIAAAAVGALPLNLVGALGYQIEQDLALSAAGIGIAVATFRLVQGVSAYKLGGMVDVLGARRALCVATALTVVCSLVITFGARSLVVLMLAMAVGGIGKSLMQPASNRMVVTEARGDQYGIVIGFKQAAAPLSTLLAGLAVPLVAMTLGWRWAFGITAVLATLCCALVLRFMTEEKTGKAKSSKQERPPRSELRLLVMIGAAMAFANATNSIIPAFWVLGETRAGVSPAHAGVVLAIASGLAIAVRVFSGIACDRLPGDPMKFCAAMLFAGAIGISTLAYVESDTIRSVGLVIGYAGVWGYPAVLWYAVLKRFHRTPGYVTGQVTIYSLVGGSIGPVVFGLIADATTYAAGWILTAFLAVASAVIMALCSPRMRA
ncbi:MAG: MFS transporter [Mycobacterium sp.]